MTFINNYKLIILGILYINMLCDRLKNITIEFLLEYLDCEVIQEDRYYHNFDDEEKVFLTIK